MTHCGLFLHKTNNETDMTNFQLTKSVWEDQLVISLNECIFHKKKEIEKRCIGPNRYHCNHTIE